MTDLYSIKDAARIFDLQPSRLRYWAQTGFVGPSVRRGGRVYYTFQDLISLRTAKDLLDAGMSMQKVRKNLESLRALLPDVAHPASKMRICSDGETVVAVDRGVAFEPSTGQTVMSFEIDTLSSAVADVLAMPTLPTPVGRSASRSMPEMTDTAGHEPAATAPSVIEDGPTEAYQPSSAYRSFVQACEAEDQGDNLEAETLYHQAVVRQPSLAAAHTNLGNLLYRRGDVAGARAAYERALEYEPTQPEARFNLGNLLEDIGETERAIAELRRVCWTTPDFADAHYNLALLLARIGGKAQACKHLQRYLELDSGSEWSTRAHELLSTLVPIAAAG